MQKKMFQRADFPFPCFYIKGTKPEQRRTAARFANTWMKVQHRRGARGAVMLDIDDTLIDGRESVTNGFEEMLQFYRDVEVLFPIHIVTARPDDQKLQVLKMLQKRNFTVPSDRLHMLPAEHYGKDYSFVEHFKWNTFLAIAKHHNGVVARLGDKLWDVAHYSALHSDMKDVKDRQCCVFMDHRLGGTLSVKLPG